MFKHKPRSQSPFGQLMSDLNALYRQHLGRREMHAGDVGTSHSLHHGALLDLYKVIADFSAPVRGGAPLLENAKADQSARQLVSEFAGHSRPQVSSAYPGRK